MRQTVITAVSVFLLAAALHAQVDSRWQYGIKAGLSASTNDASGNWPYRADFRTGLDAGAFLSWRFAFSASVSMEAHYVQNGHNGPNDWDPERSEGPPAAADFRIDYLSFPILVRLQMPVGKLPTYLLAGPYFNFKIAENAEVKKYYAANLEPFVFGGAIGFGHQWQVGARLAMFGEALYRHDFMKAFEYNGTKLNNRAFSILLGVKID